MRPKLPDCPVADPIKLLEELGPPVDTIDLFNRTVFLRKCSLDWPTTSLLCFPLGSADGPPSQESLQSVLPIWLRPRLWRRQEGILSKKMHRFEVSGKQIWHGGTCPLFPGLERWGYEGYRHFAQQKTRISPLRDQPRSQSSDAATLIGHWFGAHAVEEWDTGFFARIGPIQSGLLHYDRGIIPTLADRPHILTLLMCHEAEWASLRPPLNRDCSMDVAGRLPGIALHPVRTKRWAWDHSAQRPLNKMFHLYVQQAQREDALDLIDGLTRLAWVAVHGGSKAAPEDDQLLAHMVSLCPDLFHNMTWMLERHIHMKEAAAERSRRSRVGPPSEEEHRSSTTPDVAAVPPAESGVAPVPPALAPGPTSRDNGGTSSAARPDVDRLHQTGPELEVERTRFLPQVSLPGPNWASEIRFARHELDRGLHWIVEEEVGYHLLLPREYFFLPMTVNTVRLDFLVLHQDERVSGSVLRGVTMTQFPPNTNPPPRTSRQPTTDKQYRQELEKKLSARRASRAELTDPKKIAAEDADIRRLEATKRLQTLKSEAETSADVIYTGFSRVRDALLAAGVSDESAVYQLLERIWKRDACAFGLGPDWRRQGLVIERGFRTKVPPKLEQQLSQLHSQGRTTRI